MGLVALSFVLLGVYYAVVVPPFEVPGEAAALARVLSMAGKTRARDALPELPDRLGIWLLPVAQRPPLYYAFAALATRGTDRRQDAGLAEYPENRCARLGERGAQDNRNAVLHLEEGAPLLSGISAPIHILRVISILCSLCTVVLTYWIAGEIAPRRRATAVGAAALVALNPQFLFLSASATELALGLVLVTATVFVGVCAVTAPSPTYRGLRQRGTPGAHVPHRLPLTMGLLSGLTALTTPIGLLALFLMPCVWIMSYRMHPQRNIWPQFLRPWLLSLVVMIGVCGWWYVQHPPPTELLWGGPALGSWLLGNRAESLVDLFVGSFMAHWALFGWLNIQADELFYTAVGIVSVTSIAGLLMLTGKAYWSARSLRCGAP